MATKNGETEHEEMIEMSTFKSNINTKCNRPNKPEVAIDNSIDGNVILKIVCVGDYSGNWSKGVYIDDYNSSAETICKNPNNVAVIGFDFSLKILYKSSKKIKLKIWNIAEQERFGNMSRIYYKNADGVIVFWGAWSNSMESALKWKHHVSKALERDVPFVLVVDNVFHTTPSKWIGQGLIMNSREEMDSFCLENGFFEWFEMLERATGEKSVFGQAVSALVNKIIFNNQTATI